MSDMPASDVVAIVCSDLHLSHRPPLCRSDELDWYAAMARPLTELKTLADLHSVPILIAGDLFHKWNAPAELINFALRFLPNDIYAIPGQHDMPSHNYEQLDRSAYNTLVHSGRIKNIQAGKTIWINEYVSVTGFPYGHRIEPLETNFGGVRIILAHEYKWIPGASYNDNLAPKEGLLSKQSKKNMIDDRWMNCDVAVFGDNHKGFCTNIGNTTIWNCGGFMKRNSDEYEYKPRLGLVHKDGTVTPHFLDCSSDRYLETMKTSLRMDQLDMSEFAAQLSALGKTSLDFIDSLRTFVKSNKTKKKIKELIEDMIDEIN